MKGNQTHVCCIRDDNSKLKFKLQLKVKINIITQHTGMTELDCTKQMFIISINPRGLACTFRELLIE